MTPSDSQVRDLVRQILVRLQTDAGTSAGSAKGAERSSRPVVDADALGHLPAGGIFDLPPGAVVTPLAQDLARERGIQLRPAGASAPTHLPQTAARAVAIAADHGGFGLKQELVPYLRELGYEPVDLGTHNKEAVDYPDYAYAVASLVSQRRCVAGVVIDGAGIGSAMAANKVPGVRASMCHDISTARNAREHNHANVLTLGAGLIGSGLAKQIVKAWLETPWGGDRHARRVDKITAIEKRFTK